MRRATGPPRGSQAEYQSLEWKAHHAKEIRRNQPIDAHAATIG